MQAMVLHQQGPMSPASLKMQDLPIPQPGPHEILLKITYAAICRTDLHIIESDLPAQKLPLIPGHQGIGRVSALGSDVAKFQMGDRAGIAWLRQTCGVCEFCRSQRENLCVRPQFTGYHADGVFAQYALIHEDFAYSIPETLSDLDAVPLLCAGIIGFRSYRRCDLPQGGHLAIFGFGSSAHVILQIAKAQSSRISVVTRGEVHQQLAKAMGADWISGTANDLSPTVDSAIVFAPAGELVPQALSVLKPGGTVALAGIHMSDVPTLNYEKHLFHEKNLRSVTANTRQDGRDLLQVASQIGVHPHTQIYTFENLNQALLDLKADRISGTGVIQVGDIP